MIAGKWVREERAAEEEEVGMLDSVLVLSCTGLGTSLGYETGTVDTDRAEEMDARRFNARSEEIKLDGDVVNSSPS